ncbi:hypothetical protein [Pseudofrankia sp. DC12]|uniref:hypothetical protein n=1 Tax=Pseudofrankia sp. DC12 TaxID=683315 RepID=UPI000A075726|nr:hypothetical protein [Pseudofrankia sp. DC12]
MIQTPRPAACPRRRRALVMGLRAAHERDADSAALGDTAELLYGTALLAEGGELRDPARFTCLLAERLAEAL